MPRIPNPPFIETGIPSVSPETGNGGTAYITDLCHIPPQFRGGYENGMAVVATLPGEMERGGSLAMFLNKGRAPESLIQGWTHLKDAYIDAGYNNFSVTNISSMMASQHYGEYVYACVHRSSGDGYKNIEQIWRTRDPRILEVRHHTAWDASVGGARYPSSLFTGTGHMHVSSTYHPRIWTVRENRVMSWIDRGVGWWPAITVSWIGGPTSWQFEGGHFVQWYSKPNGRTDIRGPFLSFPWRQGRTGPPELWWIVPELNEIGERTGRNLIYAAKWKVGQWRHPGGDWELWDDDHGPGLGANGYGMEGTLPGDGLGYNPQGIAFEHDWFDDAHIVGILPPFRGLSRTGILPTYFRFHRDRLVNGRMWIMASRGENIYGKSGTWDGLWWGYSDDDGRNWRTLRPMSPAAGEPYTGVSGPASRAGNFAMMQNGMMLTSVRGSMGRNRQLLITPNWTPQGIGTPSRRPTIYKHGESKGAVWL